MIDDALPRTRVTRDDVRGKLHEANVLDLSEVYAVVLEPTDEISALRGKEDDPLDANQ